MKNYKVVITNKDLVKKTYFFETLEEARLLLNQEVILPVKDLIQGIDTRFTLHVDKIGRKKKHVYHKLPYEIVSGDNYYAYYDENGVFIVGGVIVKKGEDGYEKV